MIRIRGTKSIALLSALILLIGLGSSLSIDDGTAWKEEANPVVNGTSTCDNVSIDGTEVDVTNEEFDHEFSTNKASGEYTVSESCSSDTSNVILDSVTVDRTDPANTVEAYKGKQFDVEYQGSLQVRSFNPDNLELDASFLSGTDLIETEIGTNSNSKTIDIRIPNDLKTDTYYLKTLFDYSEVQDEEVDNTGTLAVNVRPTWESETQNMTPEDGKISYQELGDLSVDTRITEKGEPSNTLEPSDFYLKVENHQSGEVSDRLDVLEANRLPSEGEYRISLESIPQLSLGRYNFILGLDKDDGKVVENITVSKYILFSGSMTDSAGSPVNGEIFIEKEGFERRVNVDNSGVFSGNVLPGRYNFTLQFPEAELLLEGVKLDSSEEQVNDGKAVGNIRYDDVTIGSVGDSLEGVTVSNALAVWFGYPFQDGRMTMQYDTTKVNPDNLKVYECVGWNIESVNCYDNSEWEEVDVKRSWIHPTVGTVSFPVTPYNVTGSSQLLNGYMVVRNTPLKLDYIEFDDDDMRVKKGGSLGITGEITTPSGESVGDVPVEAEFIDNSGETVGSASLTRTASNGVFSFGKSVPQEEGAYRVKISAEKKPYSGISSVIDRSFDTFTQKDISIQADDTTSFYVGEKASTDFTIINSGQASLEDVKVSINGFSQDWYSFKKREWSSLDQGETVKAVMDTELPNDYCEDSCQDYRSIEVEVSASSDGNKINDISPFQAQIRKDSPENQSSEQKESSENDSSSFSVPSTGEFFERQGSVNVALGMITLFVLILAMAVKKKNDDGDRSGRSMMSGSTGQASMGGRSSVPETNVKSTEQEEEEDDQEEELSTADEEEDEFECGTCGERFDTESARDLHEQAMH